MPRTGPARTRTRTRINITGISCSTEATKAVTGVLSRLRLRHHHRRSLASECVTHYCLMPLPADPPLVQRAGGFCTLSASDGPFAPSRLAYRILASCRLTEIIASASRGAAAVRLWEPGTRDRERERDGSCCTGCCCCWRQRVGVVMFLFHLAALCVSLHLHLEMGKNPNPNVVVPLLTRWYL